MTRRQYWTILGAIFAVAAIWFVVLVLSQQASCERGNVIRTQGVAHRIAPASCSATDVLVGP